MDSRRICTLTEADLDRGAREVSFDLGAALGARPPATGVYYLLVRFDGRTEGRRLIVVRR